MDSMIATPSPDSEPSFSIRSRRYGYQHFYQDKNLYLWFRFNDQYIPVGSTIFPHLSHCSCTPRQLPAICRDWWRKTGIKLYDREDIYYLEGFKRYVAEKAEQGYNRFVESYTDVELLHLFKQNNVSCLHQAIQLADEMVSAWATH